MSVINASREGSAFFPRGISDGQSSRRASLKCGVCVEVINNSSFSSASACLACDLFSLCIHQCALKIRVGVSVAHACIRNELAFRANEARSVRDYAVVQQYREYVYRCW